MKITHLGHSCLLVESGDTRVLIDPGAFSRGFTEVTGLAAVLVTHQHADHLDAERLPVLLESNDAAQLLAEPEAAAQLGKADLQAQPLHAGDSLTVGPLTIEGVGGVHAEITPDIPRVGNVGLLVTEAGGPTLFHPGDTYQYTPEGVDVLAVPLTAPWAKLSETVAFGRAVGAGRAFPIHEAILAPAGRNLYLSQLRNHLPDTEMLDLANGEPAGF